MCLELGNSRSPESIFFPFRPTGRWLSPWLKLIWVFKLWSSMGMHTIYNIQQQEWEARAKHGIILAYILYSALGITLVEISSDTTQGKSVTDRAAPGGMQPIVLLARDWVSCQRVAITWPGELTGEVAQCDVTHIEATRYKTLFYHLTRFSFQLQRFLHLHTLLFKR